MGISSSPLNFFLKGNKASKAPFWFCFGQVRSPNLAGDRTVIGQRGQPVPLIGGGQFMTVFFVASSLKLCYLNV